jgi:hypothetical protein
MSFRTAAPTFSKKTTKTPPPDDTGMESSYLKALGEKQTPVSVKLVGGETLHGWIEYYDAIGQTPVKARQSVHLQARNQRISLKIPGAARNAVATGPRPSHAGVGPEAGSLLMSYFGKVSVGHGAMPICDRRTAPQKSSSSSACKQWPEHDLIGEEGVAKPAATFAGILTRSTAPRTLPMAIPCFAFPWRLNIKGSESPVLSMTLPATKCSRRKKAADRFSIAARSMYPASRT